MVEVNVKIIEELKFFLKTVSDDADIRKLVTQSDGDFTRDRKLMMERVAGIMINMPTLPGKSKCKLGFIET